LRLSSGWGFEGTPPTPVRTATLAREGGAPVLRLVTGARSIVVGTWTQPGRFEGTIEYPQTDSRERSIKTLVLSKLGTDGEERPQVRERARAGTVFVLYVGAWNCPSLHLVEKAECRRRRAHAAGARVAARSRHAQFQGHGP
jgi:hypothetical protein